MPLRFCTPAHVMDPQYPGVVEEIINLGEHWQSTQLRANRSEIINLTRRISEKFSACYAKLKEAGALALSEQEQNMSLTDSFALEEQLQHLTRDIFHSESPRSRHLFSSAVTPRGTVSFTDTLSRRASHRYILHGPHGGGKEFLLSKLARICEQRGHYAEIFHHSLLPDEIELIYLPDLDTAVMGVAEAPEDLRSGDVLIPCDNIEVPAEHEQINDEINRLTQDAAEYIAEAKSMHDELEAYYRKAIDFNAIDSLSNKLFNKILALSADR